jgi:hypothetical protein
MAFWDYARRHQEPLEPIVPLAVLKRQDLYPGTFAATPAGPFDVVASDVSAARLSRYSAVVVLGGVSLTPSLLSTHREYVRAGGRLLLSASQMRDHEQLVQAEDLFGARIGTRTFASQKVAATPGPAAGQGSYDEPWYACVETHAISARPLATDGSGHPVLLEHAFGKGRAYLATPEYLLEGYGSQRTPLRFFADFVRSLAASGPACVEPTGDVSWIGARQGRS